MHKKLRSLLLEILPLDLRVQIDLLSRRRDISNKEKQAELFKILRSFKIENVVPLGPGTNRYAFKLNGYVIKVATDNDGKIDNFKEFKMAKRLFPNVIKVYEVSGNGTLLVTEYIQPFQSYSEMLQYADKIREILKKLSTVYLIGDVGITSKNYANWGIRVGSDEPVCLDFAYVYDVSSDLFICSHCKSGSMLVPNKDFTELICPYPGCGHKYLFEDIRRRIGNDLHRHEIGDLSEEGYELSESNVDTELTTSRSNYLEKKSKKIKNQVKDLDEEDIPEDLDFVYNDKEENNMKKNTIEAIAQSMSNNNFTINGNILPATVVTVEAMEEDDEEYDDEDDYDDYSDIFNSYEEDEYEIPNEDEWVNKETSSLAFSGDIEDDDEDEYENAVPTSVPSTIPLEAIQAETKAPQETVHDVSPTKPAPSETEPEEENEEDSFVFEDLSDNIIVTGKQAVPFILEPANTEELAKTIPPVQETEPEDAKKEPRALPEGFLNAIQKAISKFSNVIADYAYNDCLFDKIKNSIINKKYFVGDFKVTLSSVIFRSLCEFCDLEESEIKNAKGNSHREWVVKKDTEFIGKNYYPTMLFLSRFWATRSMNSAPTAKQMMVEYKEHYKTSAIEASIQSEFLDGEFRNRLKTKLPAGSKAYDIICEYMRQFVLEPTTEENTPVNPGPLPEIDATEIATEQNMYDPEKEVSIDTVVDAIFKDAEDMTVLPVVEENTINSHDGDDAEYEYEDDDEDEDEASSSISVTLYHDEYGDVIKLRTEDEYGVNTMPIYVKKLNAIKPASLNNRWNWLGNTMPYIVFSTTKPDDYTRFNNIENHSGLAKFINVADNEYDSTGNSVVIGVYDLIGFFEVDEDGNIIPIADNDLIDKICAVLNETLRLEHCTSYIQRTLSMKDSWADEHELLEYIKDEIGDLVDIDVEEEDDEDEYENAVPTSVPSTIPLEAIQAETKAPQETVHDVSPTKPAQAANAPIKSSQSKKAPNEDSQPTVFQPIRRGAAL